LQADAVRSIIWQEDHVAILDQRALPLREEYLVCRTVDDIADAIAQLAVRGAPAIGIAAAMGISLAASTTVAADINELRTVVHLAAKRLALTRPTAVNLRWAIERMLRCCEALHGDTIESLRQALVAEALRIQQDDIASNKALAAHGQIYIPDHATIMTICNTGSLATGGFGTALGVVRAAVQQGKQVFVVACETRPLLQGARLTAWELRQDNIPYILITDSMAAWYMKTHKVDLVIAGADRIAANGDTANKIGSYALAVLAREHRIPFLIAAPCSTFDHTMQSGDNIPIEERKPEEVLSIAGIPVAPHDATVWNPAFDVVPHDYIHAFITDRGIINPPFAPAIQTMIYNAQ